MIYMEYKGTLIAVKDMEKSKTFHCSVLGRKIIGDFGANVQLDGVLGIEAFCNTMPASSILKSGNWISSC